MKAWLHRWGIAAALVLLGIALGARWRPSTASDPGELSAVSWSPPVVPAPELQAAARFSPDPAQLPEGTVALAALDDSARTTFLALDRRGARQTLAGPLIADEQMTVWRGGTLAYLVRLGLNSADNFIELRDFKRRAGWRVWPEPGHALFGFALDSSGARLIYLEVNLQITGRHAAWWLIEVDLTEGSKRLLIGGVSPEEIALAPKVWVGETVLLQGIIPFTAERTALWRLDLRSARIEMLADASDYVGLPRLSPDGGWLALPTSDPARLPRGYDAGEPPANGLRLVEAATGTTRGTVAAPEGHVFVDYVWQPHGNGLWAIDGVWNEKRMAFDRTTVVEIDLVGAIRSTYLADDGEIAALAACETGGRLTAVQEGADATLFIDPQRWPLAAFSDAEIAWAACVS